MIPVKQTKTLDTLADEIDALPEFQPAYIDNILSNFLPNPDTGLMDVVTFASLTIGTAGDDEIYLANGSNDNIIGGAGNDLIDSGDGDDIIYGGDGDDALYAWGVAKISGGAGDDIISTDAGDDQVSGGIGNDDISTWIGNDLIYGGAGDDTISAGEGDDIIIGGAGNDLIYGGEGNDLFVFDKNAGFDTVYDCEAGDAIQADGGTLSQVGDDLYELIIGDSVVSIETLGVARFEWIDGVFVGQPI